MKRCTFVTLGVKDNMTARRFYMKLFGWKPLTSSNKDVTFFDQGGWILALWSRAHLAKDSKQSAKGSGFRGMSLAHNVSKKKDVDVFMKRAKKLGAKINKPAEDVFWGGHSGYFTCPDGHLWEVAWNPLMPNKKDGSLDLAKFQPK
jgi:predicted lactoylglutathione lyase